METPLSDQVRVEVGVLRKMGLRWAVLAAWHEDLRNRGVHLGGEAVAFLEASRLKISSGCFSTCDVGCDLSHLEGLMVSADASSPTNSVDYWVDLLGQCMVEEVNVKALLKIPAVQVHYAGCGLGPCHCEE
jgi:hypothetical protein